MSDFYWSCNSASNCTVNPYHQVGKQKHSNEIYVQYISDMGILICNLSKEVNSFFFPFFLMIPPPPHINQFFPLR